ncbi:MAG: hypothetical protein J5740_04480 [Bacteroidales bacterium]|nr:hypothetical protein [Bacteroidales bacterium]
MEKTAQEVFNEIQTTIDQLRAQLDELEERLALMVKEIPDQVGDDDEMEEEPVVEVEPEPEPEVVEVEPEPEPEPVEEAPEAPSEEPVDLSIDMEALGAKTVPDAKNYQWMIDLPGSPVANVISAISLNDRVLFINTLFKEDPSLFQQTIAAFNGMESIGEAISYVIANFPDWNLNSEVVYRLMMAVRRKLS